MPAPFTLPPLVGVPLFLVFAAALLAIGSTVLYRVRGLFTSGAAEDVLFALPIGMGLVSYVVLVCGLLRFLHAPALVGGVLAAGAACAFLLLARRQKNGTPPNTEDAPPSTKSLFQMAGFAALGVLGLLTALAALAPPGGLEWDALSYHVADPKIFLHEHRIFYLPYEHHSNFPFLLQLLYALPLGIGSIAGAKLLHWACGVLLALAVYTFALRHVPNDENPKAVGLLAALLVASTPLVLWEATVAYVDLATALFTFLSLYALTLGPQNGRTSGNDSLVLSAVLMGFALGTKYTVLGFWGMLLVGILVWQWNRSGNNAGATLRAGVLWGIISLAVAAPWYVKTLLYTGNPVYPFFYQIFGGRYWSVHNAALYSADQAKFGLGKTPVDLLLGPWQATMERGIIPPNRGWIFTEYITSGFGLAPAILALVLAAGFLLPRAKRLPCAFGPLAWFGAGVYLFWFLLMQQTRYLIPALPALALIAAYVLVQAWERQSLARWVGATLCTATVLWGGKIAWQIAAPTLPVVFGQQNASDYLLRTGVGMRGLYPACQFINENAPSDAKVALFDEPRGFYLNRPYLWAEPNHAESLLPWDTYQNGADLIADLQKRGYTVLLIGAQPDGGAASNKNPDRWRVLLNDALRYDTAVKLVGSFPAYRAQNENGEIITSEVKVYFIR